MKTATFNKDRSRWLSAVMRTALLAGAVVLAGCQSKNAMDYLPKASGGYMAMNAQEIRDSDGLTRLNEEMSRLQGGAPFESEKAQKMIMAFDTPAQTGSAPPIYGVAVGQPGFADELVSQYKSAGAQEAKKSGLETYTSGTVTIAPVGDAGVLIFQNDAALERMVSVAKKKEEGARTSAVFNFVNAEVPTHAFVIAGSAQPLLELGGPILLSFEKMNPQAAAALKQVSMVSLTFDWDDHPVAAVKLHLADKAQADALAAAINLYLGFAKANPMVTANPALDKVLQPLQAASAEDGVTLEINVPADVADQLFQHIPDSLPQQ